MHQKWDERYKAPEYAYGKAPNLFFKEQLSLLVPGSLLMPAEGEGRNGVFAAQLGWQVSCCDISTEGKSKALQLASEQQVILDYFVGDIEALPFERNHFDAMGLIYAHFPGDKKAAYHKVLDTYIKPGGLVIFEAFSKNHLHYLQVNPQVGGPKDIDTLFSKEELLADFSNYDIQLLEEKEILLQEGQYHNGKGSVLRMVGKKIL